jgi:hypothetical protein
LPPFLETPVHLGNVPTGSLDSHNLTIFVRAWEFFLEKDVLLAIDELNHRH